MEDRGECRLIRKDFERLNGLQRGPLTIARIVHAHQAHQVALRVAQRHEQQILRSPVALRSLRHIHNRQIAFAPIFLFFAGQEVRTAHLVTRLEQFFAWLHPVIGGMALLMLILFAITSAKPLLPIIVLVLWFTIVLIWARRQARRRLDLP